MKKFAYAAIAGLMVLASTGTPFARQINEIGTVIEDAPLYKHHWDVTPKFNLQCTAKEGSTVRAVNKITWLNGVKLVHLRYNDCNGWTYQSNYKKK